MMQPRESRSRVTLPALGPERDRQFHVTATGEIHTKSREKDTAAIGWVLSPSAILPTGIW
jgi:hypothetical protein